jgi:hypothetical protein
MTLERDVFNHNARQTDSAGRMDSKSFKDARLEIRQAFDFIIIENGTGFQIVAWQGVMELVRQPLLCCRVLCEPCRKLN